MQGVVKKVWDNHGVSKKTGKPYTTYNIELTSGGKISCGFDRPKVQEGDHVECQTEGQYNNLVKDTLRVTGNAGAGASNSTVGATVHPHSGGNNVPAGRVVGDSRQIAISFQASRNSAIAAIEAAIAAGAAIPLPTKKGEGYDAFLALVDDLTKTYYKQTEDFVAAGGKFEDDVEEADHGEESFE